MPQTMQAGFRHSRSCPATPGIEALGLWCTMAGHWQASAHILDDRVMEEAVLLYCVDGDGWFRLGSEHYHITPGALLTCPMGLSHGYGSGSAGWEIWWVQFRGGRSAELVAAAGLGPDRPVIRPEESAPVLQWFASLLEANQTAAPDRAWAAAQALHGLLAELVRQASCRWRGRASLAALADASCTSLDELVERSGYSKYHFCRRFRAETGQSPWQYVLARKMETARELLVGTRLSVKEVAARLGFAHADYFARRFRDHTGATPQAYRGRWTSPEPQ